MKMRNVLLSLVLLFLVLIPINSFGQEIDYLNYPYKEPLNQDETVMFYLDENFEKAVIAGNGKIDSEKSKFKIIIQNFLNQKYEEIENEFGYDSPEYETFMKKYENLEEMGEGYILEIKEGIKLPDDCTSLFSVRQAGCLKELIFPNNFDTSNINNMSYMFEQQPYINPDVSKWNTSNVTSMYAMFMLTKNFNPNVRDWDVSNVNIEGGVTAMFNFAKKADPDTSKWVMNNIKFMQNLFWGSNVSEVDMRSWTFDEGTDDYSVATSLHDTNNLQYVYLSATQPYGKWENKNMMAFDFKMQIDGEAASPIIQGSHNKFIFRDTSKDTLYFVPQKVNLNIVWKDNDNKNGFRSTEQKVKLLANNEEIKGTITIPPEANPAKLNASNNWQYSFSDLDIFSGGNKIDYTVYEEDIDDYITDYVFKKQNTVLHSSQAAIDSTSKDLKDGFTIINTYMTLAEEKPVGVKPRVPKNFKKIIVDTTDKALNPIKRVFWATPNIEVELPISNPEGKIDYSQRIKYVFDHWKEVSPEEKVWNKDDKIKAQFEEETYIEAVYKEVPIADEIYVNLGYSVESGTHIGYIKGYPDNTVKPEGNITRAEAVTMIVKLKSYPIIEATGIFKDVNKNSWYAPYIEAAYKQGILEEKEGEVFRPDEKMTRGELAQLISHVDKNNNAKAPFSDIEGYKYREAIDKSYGNNRIKGYPDNTFRPDAKITRAETVAMLNRLFDRCVKEEGLKEVMPEEFKDLKDKTYWAYYEIIEASNTHSFMRKSSSSIEEIWKRIIK